MKETSSKESIRPEDVLVIDDDIEKAIRKKVLTLPQCVGEKLKGIRNKSECLPRHMKEEIVILRDPVQKPKELSCKERKKIQRRCQM